MTAYTGTASDTVSVSEAVTRTGTLNIAVPIAVVNAATGLVPTVAVGADLVINVPTAVGAYVQGVAPALSIGTLLFDIAVPTATVSCHGVAPAVAVGTPAVLGDYFALPISISGLSGSGSFDVQDATVESGEAAVMTALLGGTSTRSIWLKYVAPSDGTLTFTVTDSTHTGYQIAALIGTGISDPTLSVLASAVASGTANPTISFPVSSGLGYMIYIGDTAAGTLPTSMAFTFSLAAATSNAAVLSVSPYSYDRTPTSIVASVINMLASESVVFTVVGHAGTLATLTTDTNGAISGASIALSLALAAGTYSLRAAGQTSGRTATAPFALLNNALVRPTANPSDVAVSPPTQTGVQRWVFQDATPGGLGTYTFPANPEKASSPFAPVQVTVEHTVAQDGTPVIWEGAAQPHPMKFSGYSEDSAFHAKMQAFLALNAKFYLIDHRSRTWVVTMTEYGPDRRVVRPQAGSDTSWAANYTATVLIFAGPL